MTARGDTSADHPLYVDFLPAGVVSPGRIGMTIAPGKKGSGIGRRWDRDLDLDLTHLRDAYQTALLVCLLEPDELTRLGIEALPARARERGMKFAELAIRDGGVPVDRRPVRALVLDILSSVARGETVVVHCRGGLGRTGILVACCVMEHRRAGGHAVDADEVMRVVRAARRGAIENAAQEAWIRGFLAGL